MSGYNYYIKYYIEFGKIRNTPIKHLLPKIWGKRSITQLDRET